MISVVLSVLLSPRYEVAPRPAAPRQMAAAKGLAEDAAA